MPTYRIYHLDPDTGHITSVDEIHASDDVAAIHELQQRQHRTPVEIWQGARKVSRIDVVPEAAAFMPSHIA